MKDETTMEPTMGNDLLVKGELNSMKIEFDRIALIRSSNGISVWRVFRGDETSVLKYFVKPEFRREINNYQILSAMDVSTIKVIQKTECALLLEDITQSELRLGMPTDLADPEVAKLLAVWYRELHEKGRNYATQEELYDENDVITMQHIQQIKAKTSTSDLMVWEEVERNVQAIQNIIKALPKTLTYNDFYYTNLAVAKDRTHALMYDYNLLGTGYVYSDLRNVCSSLEGEAKHAFLAAYGEFDQRELLVDEVARVLVDLHFACQQEVFPSWAKDELEQVMNGSLSKAIQRLMTLG